MPNVVRLHHIILLLNEKLLIFVCVCVNLVHCNKYSFGFENPRFVFFDTSAFIALYEVDAHT